MARSSIWIGIGALALAMMGSVSTDTSNGDFALSNLSIGGAPALAQQGEDRRGPALPNILDTLDDLGVLNNDDEDGDDDDDGDDGDDDGDDDDDDAPAKSKRSGS